MKWVVRSRWRCAKCGEVFMIQADEYTSVTEIEWALHEAEVSYHWAGHAMAAMLVGIIKGGAK